MAPAATRDNPGAHNWTCPLCGHDRQVIATRGPDYEYSVRARPICPCPMLAVRTRLTRSNPALRGSSPLSILRPTTRSVPASPLYLKGFIYGHKIRGDVKRIRSYMDVSLLRSVVDIGSGDAARLFELRRVVPHEVECIALDLSFPPAMVERARAERITLVQGNIELDLHMLQSGAHDLIIMSQILEHLRDPIAALESLKSKLAPGGFLLLETPNRGGLDYLLFRKRYWGGYHLPRHFHLFTKASLARDCEACRLSSRAAGKSSVAGILDHEPEERSRSQQPLPGKFGFRVPEFLQPPGSRDVYSPGFVLHCPWDVYIESVCASGTRLNLTGLA